MILIQPVYYMGCKKLNNEDVVEFATCASVLKHSIQGDINLVCLDDVETLMTSGLQNIKR